MKRIIEYLKGKARFLLEITSYIFLFFTGFLDYITGTEIAFWNVIVRFVFFIIVILLLISRKSSEEKLARINSEKEALEEEFLATIAHDLKNPLACIKGYTYLLEKPDFWENLDKRREGVKSIKLSCDIMLGLIENILVTHKFEAGKFKFTFEDFFLKDLIDEIALIYISQAELKTIKLDFSVPDKIIVNADLRMVRRVFYNLLSNALRYTPEKGVITIRAFSAGERVKIEVKDTGNGIPKAKQGHLFQKFKQVNGELRGTGLGLYLVKKFLEAHGSCIRLESDIGKGSSFFFTLSSGRGDSLSDPLLCNET